MSTSPAGGWIPQMTLGWRFKMSLGEHKVEWMAEQLGVTRQTLTRWMGDKGAPPKRAYVLQWAMLTGTDARWLETGEAPQPDRPEGTPRARVRRQGLEPRTQWFRASTLEAVAA